MFGKTKDVIDDEYAGIFGDEEAADTDAQLDQLRDRVQHVESQMHSQFTSMAAYAQIAQEQVELARAESRAEAERTEGRLTQLIEVERLPNGSACRCRAFPSASPPTSTHGSMYSMPRSS